jgi:bifunctional non-homologous end joining protein LigD
MAEEKALDFSHLDKVYFPAAGFTKGDVLDYYRTVAPQLLPHLKNRPLTLERYPEGVDADSFYQKNAPSYFPDWLRTVAVTYERAGKTVHHPLVDDEAGLLYLVNLGTITFHTFLSRQQDVEHPDILVIDVDPAGDEPSGNGSGGSRPPTDPPENERRMFAQAREATLILREELRTLQMDPLLKTSGKKGLHLALPLDRTRTHAEVRNSLVELFERLVARHPALLTRELRKEKRRGRVYLDTLRMALGATLVPPYVVRATPYASVSMPITFAELEDVKTAREFTILNAPSRLAEKGDLWAGLVSKRS